MLGASGCAAQDPPVTPTPPRGRTGVLPDTAVFTLQRRLPRDSVVLHRGGATIVLSMRGVEAYHAQQDSFRGTRPPASDVAQFREEIRREYQRAGWVRLGEGMLPDLMAARLMEQGRAAVRFGPRGRLLPWVRGILEVRGSAGYRVFHAPDGTPFLRVHEWTVVSHQPGGTRGARQG
ncbi:MAG TPA: hypothetical protein VHG08_27745 [Longimicrobium sp.]|nr:hypothetical protein [Longimicrobium sp.]